MMSMRSMVPMREGRDRQARGGRTATLLSTGGFAQNEQLDESRSCQRRHVLANKASHREWRSRKVESVSARDRRRQGKTNIQGHRTENSGPYTRPHNSDARGTELSCGRAHAGSENFFWQQDDEKSVRSSHENERVDSLNQIVTDVFNHLILIEYRVIDWDTKIQQELCQRSDWSTR